MPGKQSPGSMSIRLRDVFLLALFTPVCLGALQQRSDKAEVNGFGAPRNLDDAASAVVANRQYDIGADSLRAGQKGHYRDTSPIHHDRNQKLRTSINERALATVSSAAAAAAGAPPALRSSVTTDALTPRQPARYLQDWKVEDIILLATVDGSLHARDRNNFAYRWQIGSESPMVETTYHKRNKSVDETGQELEDPLWIVEPSQDGSIYVYAPKSGFGMQKLGYTVKQLAELAPYASDGQPAVAYTAEKKTTLYTIDAATGNILKAFSSTGSITNNDRSCHTVNPLVPGDVEEECERVGTITLGRTEFTVGIQDRDTGEPISTIKYAEWSPNNRDQDLRNKYTQTMDNNYVYTRHDGTVFRLSAKKTTNRASLHHKFSSPVAQVFDVFRATHDNSLDPTLIVLPQPAAPALSDMAFIDDNESVFVNCTETGSWYALSEWNYPDITHEAPTAKCYSEIHLPSLPLTKRERKLFMGVHPIAHNAGSNQVSGGTTGYLALDPPQIDDAKEVLPLAASGSSSSLTWQNVIILLLTALLSCGAVYGYQQQRNGRLQQPRAIGVDVPSVPQADAVPLAVLDGKPKIREDEPAKETIFAHTRAASTDPHGGDDAPQGDDDEDGAAENNNEEAVKKKKATRGKRGGRKQKEKEAAAAEARAKRLGIKVPEPVEIISVAASESPQVSGPLQINSLVIHTDKVIGQGSCGTCVFEGSFEGRGVAVKRMLSQYYELASQEVSFLQQSDDHENVIRYYCQQKDDHFLYIAVELCQASLFEVWEAEKAKSEERQLQLRTLKIEIQRDMPRTLQQLAKGLHHLHKLRIIHRDIKPQNILVAFPKKFVDVGPRLVISDFGLGKNLPENVSTLIDPTGNAGTSGWKAPELISQPQAESRHSQQTSNHDSATNGVPSGVKRAADIFSLGCLFFWMLTDGVHPFEDDNGWTQLRELNIKRGLKKMESLERWSEAYEPMQLISSMLAHEPEDRPTALQVLNHPFFWSAEKRLAFLCDVSDHFEREPRGVYDDGWAGDSPHLSLLERHATQVIGRDGNNFLAKLDRAFVETLGKQRKYSGDRLLDLLRALRNKKNHYEDMPDEVKKRVGPLAGGYLSYWTDKFPRLLMACYDAVHDCQIENNDRFKGYFEKTN